MKKENKGGKVALRGFWYQIIYSILRATHVDISNYSSTEAGISAEFIFEGNKEEDIIVAYPNYTEFIQIKSRRSGKRYWRLHEIIIIFKKLFYNFNHLSKDTYTFVTDGRLDPNSSKFYRICKIINRLKSVNATSDMIIKTLNKESFSFNSKSNIWGVNGLKGESNKLFEHLKIIYNKESDHGLLNLLSRVNIIENYSEDIIENNISDILKFYIPEEKIRPVINSLVSHVMNIAKNDLRSITRKQLFEKVGIPEIPLTTPIIKKVCQELSSSQSYHKRNLFIKKGISRPKFEKQFSNFIKSNKNKYFILTGNSGTGKTSACIAIALNYANILPSIYTVANRYKNKDFISDISNRISLKLGRSDVLPIVTLIKKINRFDTKSYAKLLIIIDGIDELSPDRFNEILTSLTEYFDKCDVKILFSCRKENFHYFSKYFIQEDIYTENKKHISKENLKESFQLNEYNIHEFLNAIKYYGYKISKLDDVGNSNLYGENKNLHRPLFLYIYDCVLKESGQQFPPSLGDGIIFEQFFQIIVEKIAAKIGGYQKESIKKNIWETLVIMAKQSHENNRLSIKQLNYYIAQHSRHRHLEKMIDEITSELIKEGIIYENITNLTPITGSKFASMFEDTPINFFHKEIADWILAFKSTQLLLSQSDHQILETIDGQSINKNILMAFGVMCRVYPQKYNNIIIKLLENTESKYAVYNLMQVLPTPGNNFIKKLIKRIKANNKSYSAVLDELIYLYKYRGITCNSMSLYLAAIESFETVFEIIDSIDDDKSYIELRSEITNNIAISYLNLNKVKYGVRLLKHAYEIDPNWYSSMNLADIEFKSKNYGKAIQYFDKSLLHSNEVREGQIMQTLNSKAVCYFQLGDIPTACSIWENILISVKNKNIVHIHFICQVTSNIGDGSFRLKNYSQAKHYFKDVLLKDPVFQFKTTKESLIYLVVTYFKIEHFDSARKCLTNHAHVLNSQLLSNTLKMYDILEYKTFFNDYFQL